MKKSEKARRDANPNGGFGRNQKDARGDAEHAEEKLHIHFPPSPRPPRLRVTLSSRNPQATRPWRLKSLQRIRKHQKAKSHAETRRTRRKNSIFISLSLRAFRASACPSPHETHKQLGRGGSSPSNEFAKTQKQNRTRRRGEPGGKTPFSFPSLSAPSAPPRDPLPTKPTSNPAVAAQVPPTNSGRSKSKIARGDAENAEEKLRFATLPLRALRASA